MKRVGYSEAREMAATADGPFSVADGAFRRTFVKICGDLVATSADLVEVRPGSMTLLVSSFPENWK